MTRKRRRTKRTYAPAFKERVVARVLRGRANGSETARAIAAELDVTETLVSQWVSRAGNTPATSAGAKAAAALDAASPSIELKGLRAWVNHAVRVEVERILAERKTRP